ncbi:hypothetical protein LIER_27353 [Lithospermum erythrorhizon]|uniref:GAG-pre-integrase domain-containing protein n=1 Tax=Lithospermum erythrorhizon TaxID=34254 RepID=A0AAV3RHN0_LITER
MYLLKGGSSITMKNGVSRIVAIGDVQLESDLRHMIILKKVRHTPDFRMSLTSSGNLDDERIEDYIGTLYKARFSTHKSGICTIDSNIDICHKRLGHMTEKGLKIISKKKLIPNFEDKMMNNCSHCLMGKQHMISFNKSSQRREKVLDLVYSDVCGPMKVKILGGCSYFVTFIDDFFRNVRAYAIKTNDQVFEIFKLFHLMV